ncbi:MAG: DUF3426 domain-containing protein [Achromobacter sp.]|uniref:DUF3426 domain-containing protein n=1 Tax=Achromobacter sp. TaxID=134375 RepID=UPI003CFC3441
MALTTRCPQCGTSFKVVPDQLRVRNGLVRCGACSTVFDGRACLLPEPGAPAARPAAAPAMPVAPATPAAPAPKPAAQSLPPWEDEPETPAVIPPAHSPAVLRGRDDIRRRAEPEAGTPQDEDDEYDADEDEAIRAEPPRWAEPAEPSLGPPADRHAGDYRHVDVRDDARDDEYDDDYGPEHEDPREPVLGDTRTRYSSATDVGRAPPEFLDQDRQERRSLIRKLWGGACLVGLIALGLQLLYVYRTDIANAVPALRPVLETACRPLDCTVGYARRLERIAISSSSLQPPAGAAAIDDGRSRLVLSLVLRNRYDKPQHWPALVLDLTDLSDTVVVRRVLMPETYLTPEQLRGPFAPAGELKISVPIEVTGVQVNGYQIDKFFP